MLIAWLLHRGTKALRGGVQEAALGRVRRFADQNPDWNLRIYRTPVGLRLMATHRTFRADESEIPHLFARLDADPMYTRMCIAQKCFRARLTPKPWRIGIAGRMRPRPGVWPVAADRLAVRRA